ncbi:MAG: nucleotidyltransferase domain-containing protein [Syntrophomonadaceae bacterium]|nr:nucleotidyltransferase domain-containing protein [Syntrophomonadaceae bacterium]
MRFGIPPQRMDLIINALKQWQEIEQAAVFGSRGIGNYKNGSDVDIVIYGEGITAEVLNRLSIELNEKLPLPYYFDLVHYETLKNQELKEQIDMSAKIFYKTQGDDSSRLSGDFWQQKI